MTVTVTVTESPAARRLVPRAPRRLVPLAVAAILVFLLFPVQRRIDGVGIVQPVFERLVIVRPEWGGMVTRVEARRLDRVEIGTPLFEFAREREYAMLVRSGGALRDDESQPLRAVEERRAARMEAVRAWISRASSPPATGWERQIATWVRERAHTESAHERLVAMLGDGERRGRAGGGEVRAVDHAAGRRAPARDDGPFPSPAAGTIVSLWVAPRMQLGGYVVAEVMPDGTPIEVLGLVPLRAVDAVASGGVRAWVRAGRDVPASTAAAPVTRIDVGRAPVQPAEAPHLLPGLSADEPSVLVRLRLGADVALEDLGRPVPFSIALPRRPRLWTWLAGSP